MLISNNNTSPPPVIEGKTDEKSDFVTGGVFTTPLNTSRDEIRQNSNLLNYLQPFLSLQKRPFATILLLLILNIVSINSSNCYI